MQNSVLVKLTAIILAILLTSSILFACGDKEGGTPSQGNTDTQAAAETTEETTAPATSVPAGTDFGGTTNNVLNSIYFSTDGY